jgi:hypothetical protein
MWMETVDMPTFLASGRWKVEFFEPTTLRLAESVYALSRIGDLVAERGEALDPQEYPDHTFHFLGLEHVESHTGDLVGYAPQGERQSSHVRRSFGSTICCMDVCVHI